VASSANELVKNMDNLIEYIEEKEAEARWNRGS